jgi:predicted small secreted protein
VKHNIALFLVTLASAMTLAGCGNPTSGDDSASSGSASSNNSGTRPEVLTVLKKFSKNNGINTLNYRFLAQDSATDSGVKPTSPMAMVTYLATGYEVKFTAGWDTARPTYGYVNMPSNNTISKATGVYKYSYATSTDSSGKTVTTLTLGEAVTTEKTSVYDYYATPKYLYDNAATLAPLFVATSRTEVNNCADVAATENIAKALNVYGVLKAASSEITFTNVELSYSASSTSYTFTFYINYKNVNYVGARAVLSSFGTAVNAPLTAYLKSITPAEGA